MKQQLVDFLYAIHDAQDPYPIETCAEMLHGYHILDANDLDEILKHGSIGDRKLALVRALSSKDDVMVLVWAKILEEMGQLQLALQARNKFNAEFEPYSKSESKFNRLSIGDGYMDEVSRSRMTFNSASVFSDQISSVSASPTVKRPRDQ